MNAEELEKLHQLKEKGIITEEEFQEAKEKILNKKDGPDFEIPEFNLENASTQKIYSAVIHALVALGSITFAFGYIAPFVMWLAMKDKYPRIDRHGKVVINWMLSMLIYFGISLLLTPLLGLGILLMGALGVINVVFALVGAYKAYNGELWVYPGSISFFSLPKEGEIPKQPLEIKENS